MRLTFEFRQKMLRSGALICAALMLLSVGGCRSQTPASSRQDPPSAGQRSDIWPEALNDFRFRWSAEGEFDLATGWAVPLRAYLESFLINGYTNNIDGGYPGFQRAAHEGVERGSHEWYELPNSQRRLRGSADFGDTHLRLIGNEDLYLLRVEPLEQGFRAYVCDATFNVYKQTGDSKQLLPLYLDSSTATNPDFHNIRVWRTEFREQGALAAPIAPQRGPLPAPQTDVFGPWNVTGSERVSLWSDHDHPELKPASPDAERYFRDAQAQENQMRGECLAHYPLNAGERAKRATTVLDHLPIVEPALPGWPG